MCVQIVTCILIAIEYCQLLSKCKKEWPFYNILVQLGKEFSETDIRRAKQYLKSCISPSSDVTSGEDVLFAIDEACQKATINTEQFVCELLKQLDNKSLQSKFEQLTHKKHKTERRSQTCIIVTSSIERTYSHLPPELQAMGKFMQGDDQGMIIHIQEFLQTRVGEHSCSNAMPIPSVSFPNCTFSGLDLTHIQNPDVCSDIERNFFLCMLATLSFRKTQNHEQTRWLINLMSPIERAHCKAQMYGSYKTEEQQAQCQEMLDYLQLNKPNLSTYEFNLKQSLVYDTLGILLSKNPQGLDIAGFQQKKENHDRARILRQSLCIQEQSGYLEKFTLQLNSYSSLQSAGYARAILSCKDISLSPNDRISLAIDAESIHSKSMTEQQLLLNMLGIHPDETCCIPGMLAARFDNMLRGLRIQQLSLSLLSSTDAQQENMLHHIHTQMSFIRRSFEKVPDHWMDENLIALCDGMLFRNNFLKEQVISRTIQGFALDNPYIPE